MPDERGNVVRAAYEDDVIVADAGFEKRTEGTPARTDHELDFAGERGVDVAPRGVSIHRIIGDEVPRLMQRLQDARGPRMARPEGGERHPIVNQQQPGAPPIGYAPGQRRGVRRQMVLFQSLTMTLEKDFM